MWPNLPPDEEYTNDHKKSYHRPTRQEGVPEKGSIILGCTRATTPQDPQAAVATKMSIKPNNTNTHKKLSQ